MEIMKYGNLEKRKCKNFREIGKMNDDNRNKRKNFIESFSIKCFL